MPEPVRGSEPGQEAGLVREPELVRARGQESELARGPEQALELVRGPEQALEQARAPEQALVPVRVLALQRSLRSYGSH